MSCKENEVCKGMEATQMINESVLESDEDENEEDANNRGQPLAKLQILKNQHMPESELPLFLGDNVLGRDASCTVNLPAPSVSKQHATICISVYRRRGGQSEVDMEALVWDLGSMNGSRKGRLKLTPNVRYALSEGDSLVVADIPCKYVSWSAQTTSSPADSRTPLSQNSGVEASLPDASRENESDTSTGSKKCVDGGTKPLVSVKTPDRGSCLSFEQTPTQPQGTLVPESDSDSDSDRDRRAGSSRSCPVSDSSSHKSSPNCSTFLSPANRTVPESEDEGLISPSSSNKNRPHRHVSFTTEETDENVGRQELHTANAVKNTNACEAEEGRQEKRASEGGLLTPGKENSNVSLSGAVQSPVSKPVIPAFNMDSDTDVEGEEEGVMSAGVESAAPVILNTSQQADRPPDTVQFHMDSDTDNGEDGNEDIVSKAPETLPPSHENPPVISVIQPEGITMDSDTDVDEDAAVSDAATKAKPTSFQSTCSADSAASARLKEFHLDSDTDIEEEEEECGAKPTNSKNHETSSKLDIKLIGPNSTSAAANRMDLNSDTDDEAVPAPSANKPSSAAAVTELIAATDVGADLDILSDSDTDVEDNVPQVTPAAVQTLAGTTSKASQSDSDADTDVDEPGMPPVGDQADQVGKVDSDTDVDDEDINNGVAGVDQISGPQGEGRPGLLVSLPQLNCSTPLQCPEEVAEMETQAFTSPFSGTIRSPSIRPVVLSSFHECLEDEDLVTAETQAFIPNTWECKNSSQTLALNSSVDKKDQSSSGESLRLGLSDSNHLQHQDQTVDLESAHVEETQAKATVSASDRVSAENGSKGPKAYETDKELDKSSAMPEKEQINFELEATQPYISEPCSSDLDTADEGDQDNACTETERLDFGISSTIAMAETQLISSLGEEENLTDAGHVISVEQSKLTMHDVDATQPMASCETDNSDSEGSVKVTRKRKAKKLHIEDETQRLSNSELSLAETQPLAPSEDEDDDDDSDLIGRPRKRKSKPLQIENETQSLPCSEVSTAETQPIAACEGEQRGEEEIHPSPSKSQAKQFEDDQTQPLTNSDTSTLETLPLLTAKSKESDNEDSFSGKRKRQLHPPGEETETRNGSDISTVETQPSSTRTSPQAQEGNVKQTENGEGRTENPEFQRQTRTSSREVEEQAESSVHPKRKTRGRQKSLPGTKGKKGRASPDEDKEGVDQTTRAQQKNVTGLQKREDGKLEMEPAVNKSITKEGEEENKAKEEVLQVEMGKKKKEGNDAPECQKAEAEEEESNRQEREILQREQEEKHLEVAKLELEEKERNKQDNQAKLEMEAKEPQATSEKEKKARGESLKELQEKKEEPKQDEPQTPARGRRGRRTVAALSTVTSGSAPDNVSPRRTRSRSTSSNSVSSEMSASSVNTQESKGRGRGQGRGRGAVSTTDTSQKTTVRSTRRTAAAGAAELNKNVNPQGLTSNSIMSDSLNVGASSCGVNSESRGRGGKRREKETKTEPCSESGAPVISQSAQDSTPTARGRKSRRTERACSGVTHDDDPTKAGSQQPSATRGQHQASTHDPQPSEKDHTDQEEECLKEEPLRPKRNIRGRSQKVQRSESVEEAVAPVVSDCKDAKHKNGKRRQSEVGSNHTEKIPKTEAAKEERKDVIQEQTSGVASDTPAKPNARRSLKVKQKETCEEESIPKKARSRPSVASKQKKEESKESEASVSSVEPDASELTETPSNRASRKRQATADSSLAAKSLRSSAASPVASARRRTTSQTYRVLFTGMEDEAGERVLARLGGVIAKGVGDMNCLVTDKVRRTVKFLCAVAKGVPVVTTEWLEKSGKSGSFLSTNAFLVKDAEQEKKFNFSLEESLSAANSQPLLQGYEIHVTKSVQPEPVHMRDIIACSGATFLPKMPSSQKPHTLVISCEEDWPLCGPAVSASIPVVTAEFVLTGILQQKIDFQTHKLSLPAPTLQSAAGRGRSRKKT